MNRGWTVVFAGAGINLMFGVLYAWSIFGANLSSMYKWTSLQASLPYTTAIIMFAALMLVGGKLQDQLGPRLVATTGGILVGSGMILSSLFPTLPGVVIGFGILTGAGIGMGYSATTPAAVKWFPPKNKGLITGIVVGGFGLASLYIAPLTKYLIATYGLFTTFQVLGIGFGVIILLLAQLLKVPQVTPTPATSQTTATVAASSNDYTWKEMLGTKQFYIMWLMFLAGAIAGLMMIGHLAKIANLQTGQNVGYALVSSIAISNALARPIAGFISDKLGRGKTMMFLYVLQGAALLMFSTFTTFGTVLAGALVVTFAYGAMISVYPSAVGDFYGLKNMGFNYAILFTAWGIGGVIGPVLAGYILDQTGGYHTAFIVAAVLCFFAAVLGWLLKPPAPRTN
jgi:OFA family oxalate/formate antiporter-like MFS transporter